MALAIVEPLTYVCDDYGLATFLLGQECPRARFGCVHMYRKIFRKTGDCSTGAWVSNCFTLRTLDRALDPNAAQLP